MHSISKLPDRVYEIHTQWDEDSSVWVASSDDVPGLVAEAEAFEELHRVLMELVPELLRENGLLEGDDRPEIPIHILGERRGTVSRANG